MTTSNGACHAYALWSAWLFGSWNSTIRCTLANLKQKENQVQDDAGCARMGVNHAVFRCAMLSSDSRTTCRSQLLLFCVCVCAPRAFVKPQYSSG